MQKYFCLYKIFDKNNIKISYSFTKNLEQYIAQHNNITLNTYLNNVNSNITTDKKCNCRKNSTFPLNHKCMNKGIIYKTSIKHNGETKFDFGSTANH